MPDPTDVPPFEAKKDPDSVFVSPSAAGPSQKVTREGVVLPGKAHEARTGRVSNPGVRSLGTGSTAPRCPACGASGLKMRMNRPAGKRVYCPHCGYDQNKQTNTEQVRVNPETKIIDNKGRGSKGVRVLRQSGPR